jgi:hypothetical protein
MSVSQPTDQRGATENLEAGLAVADFYYYWDGATGVSYNTPERRLSIRRTYGLSIPFIANQACGYTGPRPLFAILDQAIRVGPEAYAFVVRQSKGHDVSQLWVRYRPDLGSTGQHEALTLTFDRLAGSIALVDSTFTDLQGEIAVDTQLSEHRKVGAVMLPTSVAVLVSRRRAPGPATPRSQRTFPTEPSEYAIEYAQLGSITAWDVLGVASTAEFVSQANGRQKATAGFIDEKNDAEVREATGKPSPGAKRSTDARRAIEARVTPQRSMEATRSGMENKWPSTDESSLALDPGLIEFSEAYCVQFGVSALARSCGKTITTASIIEEFPNTQYSLERARELLEKYAPDYRIIKTDAQHLARTKMPFGVFVGKTGSVLHFALGVAEHSSQGPFRLLSVTRGGETVTESALAEKNESRLCCVNAQDISEFITSDDQFAFVTYVVSSAGLLGLLVMLVKWRNKRGLARANA